MTRAFTLLTFGALPLVLQAQCTILSYSLSANCTQQAPLANVDLAGGTPPYQLQFTGTNGATWTTQSFQNGSFSTMLPTWPSILEPPVALQVTDAQGCVANSDAFHFIHVAMWPEVWYEPACGGDAVELYWNGLFSIAGAPGQASPCGSDSYMVSGLQGYEVDGTLATDWTEVSTGVWRLNTQLPLGTTYSVWIWNSGAPGGCFGTGDVFHCVDPGGFSVPAAPTNCGVYFGLKAALAGALPSGTLMSDGLRTANLIPLTEPYSAMGYLYTGMPTDPAIQPNTLAITGNNAVVDWVVVELRAQGDPGTVVHSKAALIQRDGDVVEVNGTSNWLYAPVPVGNYHVAIRHRNHLGVMSASPYFLHANSPFIGWPVLNFRSSFMPVHGVAARKTLGTVECMWPGDASIDGTVKYAGSANDRDPILMAVGGNTPTNTLNNVYSPLDLNLDGVVKYAGSNNDRDVVLQTIGGGVPTAVRVQQLP